MHKQILILALLASCALAQAETKTEAALRVQLAQAQADLAVANKAAAEAARKYAGDGLAATNRNAAALATVTANAAHQAALAASRNDSANRQRTNAGDATAANAKIASEDAKAQAVIATEAAANAAEAARIARAQATNAAAGNTSLLIIQGFTFAGLIAGFLYKAWEHSADAREIRRKEALAEGQRLLALDAAAGAVKDTAARLDQIHTLVNSNLTLSFVEQLDARQSVLVLLQAAIDSQLAAGHPPNAETLAVVSAARVKVAELKTTIAGREAQAAAAEKARSAQLAQPLATMTVKGVVDISPAPPAAP
jgi:hypothetical protein